MKLIRVGVDLAKNVFQLHGVDRSEKPVWRRKLAVVTWFTVKLIAPQFVKPYVRSNKNYAKDARQSAKR
jgi:transposase